MRFGPEGDIAYIDTFTRTSTSHFNPNRANHVRRAMQELAPHPAYVRNTYREYARCVSQSSPQLALYIPAVYPGSIERCGQRIYNTSSTITH